MLRPGLKDLHELKFYFPVYGHWKQDACPKPPSLGGNGGPFTDATAAPVAVSKRSGICDDLFDAKELSSQTSLLFTVTVT